MTKQEAERLRDKIARLNEDINDTPDAKLMQAYQHCPALMNYIRGSKDVLEAFYRDHDIEPEF